jgi:rhodanese-related sulfurtransferase
MPIAARSSLEGVGSPVRKASIVHRAPASPQDAPTTVEQLLAAARSTLQRLSPEAAHAAVRDGAHLVDIRSDTQRLADGLIPGAHVVARNVLEWRLDPACPYRDTQLTRGNRLLVLICDEGFQSSLAAATVQRFGSRAVTDVIGGFRAWQAAGLPVLPPRSSRRRRTVPPGLPERRP